MEEASHTHSLNKFVEQITHFIFLVFAAHTTYIFLRPGREGPDAQHHGVRDLPEEVLPLRKHLPPGFQAQSISVANNYFPKDLFGVKFERSLERKATHLHPYY